MNINSLFNKLFYVGSIWLGFVAGRVGEIVWGATSIMLMGIGMVILIMPGLPPILKGIGVGLILQSDMVMEWADAIGEKLLGTAPKEVK